MFNNADSNHFQTPAAKYLDTANIPYRLFVHTAPLHSVEQAAQERGQIPDQVVRSILFRLSEQEFFLALMPGNQQISWKVLRHHFHQSRLSLASSQEVLDITGYAIGAVSPFGLKTNLRILVDSQITQHDEISLGSGRKGTAIMMKSKDFLNGLGTYELMNLSNLE